MNESFWRDGRMGKRGTTSQIMFAQVREDAAIELEVLRSRPAGETAFCIASGGCTAFALLLADPARLHVVDINTAQVFLVEIKKAALTHLTYAELLDCLLKNALPFYRTLRPHLSDAARAFWDNRSSLLARGLNNCGTIEKHLREIIRFLPLAQRPSSVRRIFAAESLEEQRDIYQKSWDHWGWKLAFQISSSRPVLRRAYGDAAIKYLPPTFAEDMKRRVDETFTRHPIRENGYLWQIFRGVYPPEQKALPLYLQQANQNRVQEGLERMHVEHADAADYLQAQKADSFGFFALSNIIEMAPPDFADRLLPAVAHAGKPGAMICVRSVLPSNISAFQNAALAYNARFEPIASQDLEDQDRSIFCKNLLVLRLHK